MFIVSTTFTGFQLSAHAQYLETHHEPGYFTLFPLPCGLYNEI